VTGYHRIRPLPANATQAIPVYVRARGLQIAVKALHRRLPGVPLMRERLHWLAGHTHQLEQAIAMAFGPEGST